MIFHAFYHPKTIGDIVLMRKHVGQTMYFEKKEDVIILQNAKKETIGYNILHASKHYTSLNTGLVKITEDFIAQSNVLLQAVMEPLLMYDPTSYFVVGKVKEIEAHPDSDHLHICQVDVQEEILQIVCGASNVAKDQRVVVAKVNAVMPDGTVINPSVLRKVPSQGMLCSAKELQLAGKPEKGILILNDSYHVGDAFII